MTVQEWDAVFRRQQWGRWADTRFVEWFMRTYGDVHRSERDRIRVLELGCGAGAQLRFLQAEGFHAFGVDGSRTALQQAKRNLELSREFAPNVALVEADLLQFEPPIIWGAPEPMAMAFDAPVRDAVVERPDMGFFDCIVDVCTLQHIPAGPNAQIISRARRWLKPGGWIFSKHAAMPPDGIDRRARGSVPEPGLMPAADIQHVYPGFELTISQEVVTDMHFSPTRPWDATSERRHWIITGRKV